MAKTKTKNKAAAPVVEEVEDLELEDLEEDVENDAPPANGAKGQDEVVFGASDLAKHLSKVTGKTISPRELRTLIRKMARDGSGRVKREIVAENRSRYNWSGLDDPEVKAIVKAVTGGELEANKKEALARLKADKAARVAAEGGKTKSKKAAPVAVVEDDDDEDFEVDEDDD